MALRFHEAARLLLRAAYSPIRHAVGEYTEISDWNPEEFRAVVAFLRTYSVVNYRDKFPVEEFYLNGYRYYTSAHSECAVRCIYRYNVVLAGYSGPGKYGIYDLIADKYVTMFKNEEALQEERDLLRLLNIRGRVLDIGCGEGMLLNHLQPEDYVGIDPSEEMLKHLRQQYPAYADKVICCPFEQYYGEGFDTIVSLFGSPSYIDPVYLSRLKGMLAPGGVGYFMFFRKDYSPVTHKLAGVEIPFYRGGFMEVMTMFDSATVMSFNQNYDILKVQ